MGFIQDIINAFSPKKAGGRENLKPMGSLDGYSPIFSQFGDNIYASDVVQQAISCIVQEMKKLMPKHIVVTDGMEQTAKRIDINSILSNPNELMTTSDFIEKCMWTLFFNYNVFIYPSYRTYKDREGNTRKEFTGLYPLNPTQVDFLEDPSGTMFVEFKFANNYKHIMRYADVIHIRKNYSVNDYMGGNDLGQPDYEALQQTLEINKTLLDSVSFSAKLGLKVQAVIKYGSLIGSDKLEKARQEFQERLDKGENGILSLDQSGEFIPINRSLQLVDKDTLEFIDTKILRFFGVPLPILTGDYSKQQYEAFYQKTLEPLIIAFSQAFTKTLFSKREIGFGNKIIFYPEDLIFLTNEQKLALITEAGGRGALTNNQILRMFGLPPYEGGDVRYMSLNYVDVNIANQYQLNNSKIDGGENNAEATNE